MVRAGVHLDHQTAGTLFDFAYRNGSRISFSNCTFFFGIILSLMVSSFNFQGQMFSQEVKLGTFYGVLCLFDSKNCFVVLC